MHVFYNHHTPSRTACRDLSGVRVTVLSNGEKLMTQNAWLKCESIAPGMFSDEVAIVVQRSNGQSVAHFVPKDAVEENKSRVLVEVVNRSGVNLATLPTAQPSVIPVRASDLASE